MNPPHDLFSDARDPTLNRLLAALLRLPTPPVMMVAQASPFLDRIAVPLHALGVRVLRPANAQSALLLQQEDAQRAMSPLLRHAFAHVEKADEPQNSA